MEPVPRFAWRRWQRLLGLPLGVMKMSPGPSLPLELRIVTGGGEVGGADQAELGVVASIVASPTRAAAVLIGARPCRESALGGCADGRGGTPRDGTLSTGTISTRAPHDAAALAH
jgi:hypothetical protein